MTYRSDDPVADYHAQDYAEHEEEMKCPKCDNCGKHIPRDEELFEARIGNQTLILCSDCCGTADWQFITELGECL